MAATSYKDRIAETSTFTGGGTVALLGAINGFASFTRYNASQSGIPVLMEALDAANQPTGEWEVALCTLSADKRTLTRNTVRDSSNDGATVSFGAGTKRITVVNDGTSIENPLGSYVSEKAFEAHFTGYVADQKIRFNWPANTRMQGRIEITCATGYDGANATGYVKKIYGLYLHETNGAAYTQEVSTEGIYPCTLNLTISNFIWDATNLCWYVAVASPSANHVSVTIKTYAATHANPAWTNMSASKVVMSAIYIDPIVYPPIPVGISNPQTTIRSLAGTTPKLILQNTDGGAGNVRGAHISIRDAAGTEAYSVGCTSPAYDEFFIWSSLNGITMSVPTTKAIDFKINNVPTVSITSLSLAVTGNLTTTGTITATGKATVSYLDLMDEGSGTVKARLDGNTFGAVIDGDLIAFRSFGGVPYAALGSTGLMVDGAVGTQGPNATINITARDATANFLLYANANILNFYTGGATRATLNTAGMFGATGGVNANSTHSANTTNRNPGVYSYNTNGDITCGMEWGWSAAYGNTNRIYTHPAWNITFGGITGGGYLQSHFEDWVNINATGISLPAGKTITIAGTALATVTQLANYLPLSGGNVTGGIYMVSGAGPNIIHRRADGVGSAYPAYVVTEWRAADNTVYGTVGMMSGGGSQFFVHGKDGINLMTTTDTPVALLHNTVEVARTKSTGLNIGEAPTSNLGNVQIFGQTDPGTIPAVLNVRTAGVGGGAAVPQYGIKVDAAQSFNGASAMYGVWSKARQNVGGPNFGVWGESDQANSVTDCHGVHGRIGYGSDHGNNLGYGGPAGVYGEAVQAFGTSNVNVSYAGMFQHKGTKGAWNVGVLASTISGGTNVRPLICQHDAATVFEVTPAGAAATGTITASGLITGAGVKSTSGFFHRADGANLIGSTGNVTYIYATGAGGGTYVFGNDVWSVQTMVLNNAGNLSVAGTIAASGTITTGGAAVATVTQLANYLPLTGGRISGILNIGDATNQFRIFDGGGIGYIQYGTTGSVGLPLIIGGYGGGDVPSLALKSASTNFDVAGTTVASFTSAGLVMTAGKTITIGGVAVGTPSDTAYGAGWNGATTVAPSQNAVYDKMQTMAPLASPALTGSPTIGGTAPLRHAAAGNSGVVTLSASAPSGGADGDIWLQYV